MSYHSSAAHKAKKRQQTAPMSKEAAAQDISEKAKETTSVIGSAFGETPAPEKDNTPEDAPDEPNDWWGLIKRRIHK
jgi:hypothetical protein